MNLCPSNPDLKFESCKLITKLYKYEYILTELTSRPDQFKLIVIYEVHS